ncbi:MAG: hypothetical protein LBM98_03825 [Oscillospiraceae bacterium]|nr:hypothetical protein [Oscillospiraceae bacterium]
MDEGTGLGLLRAARKDGQGFALPCPGALRRDGGRGYVRARRGETTPPPTAAPLPRGEFTGEGGFETRPYVYCTTHNPHSSPRHYSLSIINYQNPFPSWEGCRPQAAGWFPPQGATPVQTLVSDI